MPEFPVPIESIAEDLLGLAVERVKMECSGMLLPDERRILVNADEHETRQRFTVAHELGHWVCQCLEGSTQPVYCRADQIGESTKFLEREANVFAAELLMPGPAVGQEFARCNKLPAVATAFGVSAEAMAWRLYSFNLGPRPAVDMTDAPSTT